MEIEINKLYKYIGVRIKDRRRELKLTQQQLADLLSIERTSVTNIESGIQRLPLHILYQLCYVLKLDLNAVLLPIDEIVNTGMTVDEQLAQMLPDTARGVRELFDKLSENE